MKELNIQAILNILARIKVAYKLNWRLHYDLWERSSLPWNPPGAGGRDAPLGLYTLQKHSHWSLRANARRPLRPPQLCLRLQFHLLPPSSDIRDHDWTPLDGSGKTSLWISSTDLWLPAAHNQRRFIRLSPSTLIDPDCIISMRANAIIQTWDGGPPPRRLPRLGFGRPFEVFKTCKIWKCNSRQSISRPKWSRRSSRTLITL